MFCLSLDFENLKMVESVNKITTIAMHSSLVRLAAAAAVPAMKGYVPDFFSDETAK